MALQVLIDKVVHYSDVDGDTSNEGDAVGPEGDASETKGGISVEAFEEALKEDEKALAAEFGMPDGGAQDGGAHGGAPPADPEEDDEEEEGDEALGVEEAVQSVRGDDEPFNWALICTKLPVGASTPRTASHDSQVGVN